MPQREFHCAGCGRSGVTGIYCTSCKSRGSKKKREDEVMAKRKPAAEAATNTAAETATPVQESGPGTGSFQMIPVEEIRPHPDNPRKHFEEEKLKELAESIKECGIVQPLVVVQVEAGYQLVAGERRWRAAKLAGLETVPAVVRDLTEQQILEVMLLENLQREDLNAIEEAKAYGRLIQESGWTQEELGGKIGKSQGYIANRLRLMELPAEAQENISRGILSPSQGRALLKYTRWPKILAYVTRRALEEDMTVQEIESGPSSWQLERDLKEETRRLYAAKFDEEKLCRKCKDLGTGNFSGLCLKPSCFDKVNAEAARIQSEKLAKKLGDAAGGGAVPRLQNMDYNAYERFSEHDQDEKVLRDECQSCDKLRKVLDHCGDLVEVCTHPSCFLTKRKHITMERNRKERMERRSKWETILLESVFERSLLSTAPMLTTAEALFIFETWIPYSGTSVESLMQDWDIEVPKGQPKTLENRVRLILDWARALDSPGRILAAAFQLRRWQDGSYGCRGWFDRSTQERIDKIGGLSACASSGSEPDNAESQEDDEAASGDKRTWAQDEVEE